MSPVWSQDNVDPPVIKDGIPNKSSVLLSNDPMELALLGCADPLVLSLL
jgi:hypothetical protein